MTKNKASSTHGTPNIGPVKRVENAFNCIVPHNLEKSSGKTKFSLFDSEISSDSDGKQLTKEQSEYFNV